MTKEYYLNRFNNNSKSIEKHELLLALSFEEDDFDVVFTVPVNWLKDVLEMPTVQETQRWAQTKYNSNDSKTIFELAAKDQQLVTFNIFM